MTVCVVARGGWQLPAPTSLCLTAFSPSGMSGQHRTHLAFFTRMCSAPLQDVVQVLRVHHVTAAMWRAPL